MLISASADTQKIGDVMKALRAKLLRYIVQTHFTETFGEKWWDTLLSHMREEAQDVNSSNGKKYMIALKQYGRSISFEDLDTSILCTVILWDRYFQYGKNQVNYTGDELQIARKLQIYRNRISHEEGARESFINAEEETLKVLREAIDKLSLMTNNPGLAREILTAYAKCFGIRDEGAATETFMELSSRFEEAEALYKWDIRSACSIYRELAEQNFQEAQKKLLFIYTHTTSMFDLEEAVRVAETYPELLEKDEQKLLKHLRDVFPHVIWGTPHVCELFYEQLRSGELIWNAQAEQYINWVEKAFPRGIYHYAWASHLNKTANPDCWKLLLSQTPDLKAAKDLLEKTEPDAENTWLRELIALAERKSFDPKDTEQTLKNCAKAGYIPLIEMFAMKQMKSVENGNLNTDIGWIRFGAEKGSRLCEQCLSEVENKRQERKQDTILKERIRQQEEEIKRLKTELEKANEEIAKLRSRPRLASLFAKDST